MTDSFKALVARREGKTQTVACENLPLDFLTPDAATVEGAGVNAGNDEKMVSVAIEYSTLNFKDGLAISGAAPIVQKHPLILGIDYAGTVLSSADENFSPGDKVVLNGFGASEYLHGGYAERALTPGKLLVKLPQNLSTRQAMCIGTAGYTAMLSVMALQYRGPRPGDGPILVTGAAGGVGSVAVTLLASLGYEVVASTGRPEERDFLEVLGARQIIDRNELSEPGKPLQKERWAGVVDSVGSHTLANALAQTRYDGIVTACGLAQGADLPASVMPFILRSVQLRGVDSVQAPRDRREEAWARLSRELDPGKLEGIAFDLAFDDLDRAAREILAGQVRGRAIVAMQDT